MDPILASFAGSAAYDLLARGSSIYFSDSMEDHVHGAAAEVAAGRPELQPSDLVTVFESDAVGDLVTALERHGRPISVERIAAVLEDQPVAKYLDDPEDVIEAFLEELYVRLAEEPSNWHKLVLRMMEGQNAEHEQILGVLSDVRRAQVAQLERIDDRLIAEHSPVLSVSDDELYPSSPGTYNFSGRVRNGGNGVATDFRLGFEIYVDTSDVEEGLAAGAVTDRGGSTSSLAPLRDLRFHEAASVTITGDVIQGYTFEPPIEIRTRAFPMSSGDERRLHVAAGAEAFLSGESAVVVESNEADRQPRFDVLFNLLRKLGFRTVHVWIGLQCRDVLGNPHEFSLQERSLDVYKSHYAENPFEEWRACDYDLADLRETTPTHPDS